MSLLDRKNMLWEGSRMFLPEHRKQLQTLRSQHHHQEVPTLAEDQMEELNWRLQEALQTESAIVLDYAEGGQIQSFCGFVEEVNANEGYLRIVNGQEKRKISLHHVYGITLP